MNLFEYRREKTRAFFSQVKTFSLLSGEEFKLVGIKEIDRSFKCDDYRMVFENLGTPILLRGEDEILWFSVYVCDWSNTVTISFENIFTDEEEDDTLDPVSKPIRVKHPVTAEKIREAFQKHASKYRFYKKG